MSDTTISPNMGLVVPAVGVDPGPDWANNINADLGVLDQHNHASGQGVQINPSGLDINSDLSVQGNNLTAVNAVQLENLSSPITGAAPYLTSIYSANGDMYFNDAAGNQVRVTAGGAVNATSSGISSGTATASFVGGALVVDANVNTPANVQGASFLFGNNTPGSNFITLQPPNSLASNYSITLPPQNTTGSTVVLTMDTSGNIGIVADGVSPTGSITMYGGTSAPGGWLLCDGTSYLRTAQSTLFAAIGTAYGSVDATHFNVPNFQGIFPRGVSGTSGNDPDATSRTFAAAGGNTGNNVGSYQQDAAGTHTHYRNSSMIQESALGAFGGPAESYFGGGGLGAANFNDTGIPHTGNVSSENRPLNLYVNFIIKT